ncbi:MAG: MFS transporter [Dehalococcoidia bacterium]
MTRSERPPLKRTFQALRIPNYRLFWCGQLVSQTGTWVQNTALSWFILHLTKSPLALGTLSTLQFLPMLLFSLYGGVLADRFPKRRLLIATQSTMMTAALLLAILTSTGLIGLPLIYILVSISGLANALDNPARQAFVVEMVGPSDLPNAVALNSTLFQLSRTLGPALGGLGVATAGFANCFYLNAASFLAVIASLLLMRPDRFFATAGPARGKTLKQVGEGLRYAVTTPDIALIVLTMGVLGIFGYNFGVFIPLLAKFVLHLDALGFGLLSVPMSIGSIAATLTVAYMGTARRRTLIIGGTAFSLLLLALALSSWLVATVAVLTVMGYFSSIFSATANARMQLVTPSQLRGRVMSIYTLLFLGSTPIGSLIAGALADAQGAQPAIAEMALVCLAGMAAGLLFIRRSRGRLLPDRVLPAQVVNEPDTYPGSLRSPPLPAREG